MRLRRELYGLYIVRIINFLLLLYLEGNLGEEKASVEQFCKSTDWLHLEVTAEMTDTISLGKQIGSRAESKARICSSEPCVEDLPTKGRSPVFYGFSFKK